MINISGSKREVQKDSNQTTNKRLKGRQVQKHNMESVDHDIETMSSIQSTFHKTIAIPNNIHDFASIKSCDVLLIEQQELSRLCSIGTTFGDELELGRMKLYCHLMTEIQRLLQANSDLFITYLHWVECFNNIYSHMLAAKLKGCSSYYHGPSELLGFRSKKFRKADNTAIITFYNLQKSNAEKDVREFMKILNMVLKDSIKIGCVGANYITTTTSNNLICFEDYSSVYKSSEAYFKFNQLVKVAQNTEGSTTTLTNLNNLLGTTEPEVILMVLQNPCLTEQNNDLMVMQYYMFICLFIYL